MSTENQKPMQVTKKHIASLGSPMAVVVDAAVGVQLVNKFSQMYRVSPDEAQRFYDREKDNFSKLISQNPALRECTPMSIYMAFGRVMALKLSFENGRSPLVYLIPGNRKVGDGWIKEVVATPSPDGEKEVRLNAGILKKVGQPIVVHEGDHYKEFLNADGEVSVEWEDKAASTKIIGSFIRLVEPDGTVVFKTFKPTDIDRWQKASAKKNNGKTNALYTSGIDGQIDESFLKGKTLLHSFKGYKQVDYGQSNDGSFVPDTKAAAKINPSYNMADELDAYEEVDSDLRLDQQPTDYFTNSVNEPEAEKPSITIQASEDDDVNF